MPQPKILIVCDEKTITIELGAMIAGLGYPVVAATGRTVEAVAAMAQTEPDLALLDMEFGSEADARAAGDEMRLAWPAPILLLSSERGEGSPPPTGASTARIVKPYTARELHLEIELALCRHNAVREAREQEERFFAVSIDMLCFLDFNGYFKRLNPAWERTLGFTIDELMSRPFIDFVHPDDRERTLTKNLSVRHGGQSLGFENRYLCKDGTYRWFLWNATSDLSENVIYSVARDITARKQADDERDRLVGQLRSALAEVGALREILPICSYCRKVRDDEDYWQSVESYFSRRTNTRFSHGICPSCMTTEVDSHFED